MEGIRVIWENSKEEKDRHRVEAKSLIRGGVRREMPRQKGSYSQISSNNTVSMQFRRFCSLVYQLFFHFPFFLFLIIIYKLRKVNNYPYMFVVYIYQLKNEQTTTTHLHQESFENGTMCLLFQTNTQHKIMTVLAPSTRKIVTVYLILCLFICSSQHICLFELFIIIYNLIKEVWTYLLT